MKQLRAWVLRLRGVLRRESAERDFSAEMESHLAMDIEDGMRAGLSPQEARRQALIRLGGLEQAKIAHREQRGVPWLEMLLRDAGYAARTLRRSPGFAVVSILILAAGIGANTALFTVVRSVLLRPLPFAQPDRLVSLHRERRTGHPETENVSLAAGDFYDWQRASHFFSQMAIWRWSGFNLSDSRSDLPEFVNAANVSWNLLDTLGVKPILGRGFTGSDDQLGASPTAILSWSLYQRRFGGDPSILGKSIHLNQRQYVVVGVLPKWMQYPDPLIQILVPFREEAPAQFVASHNTNFSMAIARLKPGVTSQQAVEEISAVQAQTFHRLGGGVGMSQAVMARPMIDDVVGDVKTPLYVLMAAVVCLQLIACLNLSNLLVARAAARRRAVAIRMALGSSRLRLCREQLMESLLISITGGALGLIFATFATRWLTTHWVQMPRAEAIHPDAMVLLFAIGVTLLTGLLAGLLPAISATGEGILAGLQESSRSVGGSGQRTALRKTLLTVEVALTVVLLVGAGLLFKSFVRLRSVDIGCATKNVLTMRYFLRGDRYAHPEQIAALHTQLLEKIRALPGVEAAGLTNVVPADGYWGDDDVDSAEHPLQPGERSYAMVRTADPGYFAALQIPLLRGRVFTGNERLSHDHFVVINRKLADELFPGSEPIGRHLRVNPEAQSDTYEIIGVVANTPFMLEQPVRPMFWFPILSGSPTMATDAALAVRTRGDAAALALPIQKAIASIDPALPVSHVLTMEQIVGQSTATSSFSATLLLVFAGLSLLLAAVGLYGVLAFLVTQRTTEIGIRMALGARREQVLKVVLFDGLRPAFFGLILGLAGSAAATRLIRSVLFATQPLDAWVYVSVIGVLGLAVAASCLAPAWRATRIDPMQALRAE